MYLVTCPHSCNKACAVLQHTLEHSHPTLLFHTGLPKSGDMDSDDDTLHPHKRKRLRVLEDDLVCSEVYSNTSTCTAASTCIATSQQLVRLCIRQTLNQKNQKNIFQLVFRNLLRRRKRSPPVYQTHFHFQLTSVLMCICVWPKRKWQKLQGLFSIQQYSSGNVSIQVIPITWRFYQHCQIIAKYPFSWIKEFRSKSCKKFTCLFHACTAFPDGGYPFFPFSHL